VAHWTRLKAQRDFAGEVAGQAGLGIDEDAELTGIASGAGDARARGEFRGGVRASEDEESVPTGLFPLGRNEVFWSQTDRGIAFVVVMNPKTKIDLHGNAVRPTPARFSPAPSGRNNHRIPGRRRDQDDVQFKAELAVGLRETRECPRRRLRLGRCSCGKLPDSRLHCRSICPRGTHDTSLPSQALVGHCPETDYNTTHPTNPNTIRIRFQPRRASHSHWPQTNPPDLCRVCRPSRRQDGSRP
jgi:hypothetical protein